MYHLIGIYVKYLVQNNKPYSVRDENQYWFIWMFTRTVVQSLVGLAFQVAIMFIDECHILPIWDMEAAIKSYPWIPVTADMYRLTAALLWQTNVTQTFDFLS